MHVATPHWHGYEDESRDPSVTEHVGVVGALVGALVDPSTLVMLLGVEVGANDVAKHNVALSLAEIPPFSEWAPGVNSHKFDSALK